MNEDGRSENAPLLPGFILHPSSFVLSLRGAGLMLLSCNRKCWVWAVIPLVGLAAASAARAQDSSPKDAAPAGKVSDGSALPNAPPADVIPGNPAPPAPAPVPP